jgi:hypothetical protein
MDLSFLSLQCNPLDQWFQSFLFLLWAQWVLSFLFLLWVLWFPSPLWGP